MIPRKYYKYVMQFFFSLCLALAVRIAFTLYFANPFSIKAFLSGVAQGFITSFIVGSILPVNQWGEGFAHKLKAKPGTMKFRLLSTLVKVAIFSSCMCLTFTVINLKLVPIIMSTWVKRIPIAFGVAFPTALFTAPLIRKLANALVQPATVLDTSDPLTLDTGSSIK